MVQMLNTQIISLFMVKISRVIIDERYKVDFEACHIEQRLSTSSLFNWRAFRLGRKFMLL